MDIRKSEIILGGDVNLAAGPVSNGSSSNMEFTFETEIYSYQWSKGLIAGVSLTGGILSFYQKPSYSLYGIDNVNMDMLK